MYAFLNMWILILVYKLFKIWVNVKVWQYSIIHVMLLTYLEHVQVLEWTACNLSFYVGPQYSFCVPLFTVAYG